MSFGMRVFIVSVAALLSVFAPACGQKSVSTPESSNATISPQPDPAVDPAAARQVSDAMVDDFLHDRRQDLMGRMESGFQQYYSAESFSEIIDRMTSTYGKPLDVEYKIDGAGRKTAIGYNKPIRRFWYATRTSIHPRGKVFITVEIVHDENALAGSSLTMVTFPLGEIPDYLK